MRDQRTGRQPSTIVIALALLAGAVTFIDAQGRGAGQGRGGGPGRPQRSGTVEQITVHGRALEGNLEGDSADRMVTVYLPPSYQADQARRFPVVYLLHGYTGRDDTFTSRLASLQQSADRLAAAQGFSEPIVVTPDAYTLHEGSMYSSSPTIGDWERFVAEDLVAAIDARYRTFAVPMSRGLAGHSMGGYGALRIGMKRPEVFSSLYMMSACCLTADRNPAPDTMAAAGKITTREAAEEAARAPGFGPSVLLASAAAWSSNPSKPPLYLDLPVRDGKVQPDIVAKWAANASIDMLPGYVANLQKYYAIGIDIGTGDSLLAANRELHQLMTKLHVPHSYEEYDGDHTNRIRERIERNVLPFFSQFLQSPANPSSPRPQR